jgi:DNA-binding NarL/FixJ family response regulator
LLPFRLVQEGYLLKHETAEVLQEAAVHVMEFAGAPMSPAIARKAFNLLRLAHFPDEPIPATSKPEGVSERELEVLQLMIPGLDAKGIASEMNLSVFTVRKHIANIHEKLHVNSKAQVMSMGHKESWFRS